MGRREGRASFSGQSNICAVHTPFLFRGGERRRRRRRKGSICQESLETKHDQQGRRSLRLPSSSRCTAATAGMEMVASLPSYVGSCLAFVAWLSSSPPSPVSHYFFRNPSVRSFVPTARRRNHLVKPSRKRGKGRKREEGTGEKPAQQPERTEQSHACSKCHHHPECSLRLETVSDRGEKRSQAWHGG